MLAKPLEFPQTIPADYLPLTDDPPFDPARHLALEPPERMTIVPGYVSLDLSYKDAIDVAHIANYGEPGIQAEVLRHGAWRAKEKLEHLICEMDLDLDTKTQRDHLRAAIDELARVLDATG